MKKILFALAAVPLSGCGLAQQYVDTNSPGPAPLPVQAGHRVVIIGDSVSAASKAAFEASIDDVYVSAVIGRGTDTSPFGGPTIREAVIALAGDVEPGGWLVIQDDGSPAITSVFVQQVANTLPDDRGLAWVSPDNYGHPDDVDASTTAVVGALPAQPIHAYIDWRSANVEGLTVDGLHPNDAGARVLAGLVHDVTG